MEELASLAFDEILVKFTHKTSFPHWTATVVIDIAGGISESCVSGIVERKEAMKALLSLLSVPRTRKLRILPGTICILERDSAEEDNELIKN